MQTACSAVGFGRAVGRNANVQAPTAWASGTGETRGKHTESGSWGESYELRRWESKSIQGDRVSPTSASGAGHGPGLAGSRGHAGRDFVLTPEIPFGYGYLFEIGYCRRPLIGGE